ncbi:MAG: 1-acyl-sn-glycerol-3-phosphate acyltransferase [Dysgonamonadaceae bacterium]|jgi:1-acyl-sn-glycerol-3-phosphate acyltransferase|nr:1-acyl-sn-glycerol-3-phosphate acyltransferase [Dysgonamonadaceae bacterium]
MKYEFNRGYAFTRIFTNLALRLNFGKLIYVGKENADTDYPLIFAPNHRNAVIDPMILINFISKKQLVFLARADVFKNPKIARILVWLHIMPVYRIRDGVDNLKNNEESFELSGNLLKKKIPLALFPEGRHNPKLSLLPIQKAIPRIVFPIEEEFDFTLGSRVIPVGIYYPDIFGFLSDAYITFGKPILMSDYKEQYEINPQLAANQIRQDLGKSLSELIVDIQNDEYYDEYVHAIDWNAHTLAKQRYPKNKEGYLLASQDIVRKLDKLFEHDCQTFDSKIENFRSAHKTLKEYGLTSKDPVSNPSAALSLLLQTLLLVVTFPIALFGFINGIFPIIGYKKLLGLFKEEQFIPSVRYASGMLLVPIFDLIQTIIIGITTMSLGVSIAYFLLMPATFYFACWWRKWAKGLRRKWKVNRFKNRFPDVWEKIIAQIKL